MSVYDTENAPGTAAEASLTIYPAGGKWLEPAPDGLAVGAISLRGWDLRAVKPLPAEYSDQDVYLAKLVYELDFEPRAPRPAWMEVGFSFQFGEATELYDSPRPTVLDALPRTVLDPQTRQGFRLNQSLMFVPHDNPSTCAAFLDDISPTVDVFGIGSSEIRWRHAATRKAPLRLGSRIAWITLAAPVGTEELTVQVGARFELRGGSGRPGTGAQPVRFPVPLRPSELTEPSLDGPRTRHGPMSPRVFISYAQETPEHCDFVREFADFLVEQGCDLTFDAFVPPSRQDWDTWATNGILQGDFVALIASPRMRAVGNGEAGADENRGLQSELSKMRNLLQVDRPTWTRRILPVVLPGCQIEDIPLAFANQNETYYKVTSFTPEGAKDFLETVFYEFGGQRPVARPLAA
jgi:hypothetical protein